MRFVLTLAVLGSAVGRPVPSSASAYNGHPKLLVVIVIDQFRGDYLERYRDQFGDAGFRFLLDQTGRRPRRQDRRLAPQPAR